MALAETNGNRWLSVHLRFWICLALCVAVLSVYWPVRQFDFIAYDDNLYVTENQRVLSGLNAESVGWAFRFEEETFYSYWQPLTWLSHMLDVELYGLNAGNHHLTNLTWHILNALLLFLFFERTTGALWPSALTAALFALHPINVESVAWVAARKNVLSTFFWLLTMVVYAAYVKRQTLLRYVATLLVFILGLMTKPMLITLPFVLLILDYWPLGRVQLNVERGTGTPVVSIDRRTRTGGNLHGIMALLLEKVPFFLLSAVSIYLASSLLHGYRSNISTALVPWDLRFANALVSYVKYMFKMIYPVNLALIYPFPPVVPAWQPIGALVLLVSLSVLAFIKVKSKPYAGIGWLWYLGTLVPMLGLIQAGVWPEMADRWAYVPLIGLFVILSWGGAERLACWKYGKSVAVTLAAVALISLAVVTRSQVGFWQNSIMLWEHTLKVTSANITAHNNVGVALARAGRPADAIDHYNKALQIDSRSVNTHMNLANALVSVGREKEALEHFREALRINPLSAKTHYNLGLPC